MTEHPVPRWVASLRAEAERYADVGALVDGAKLCRELADRLEAEWHGWLVAELTLRQAAQERGWSYSQIQRAVTDGRIPNVGRKHRPRVRRCDLHGADGPDLVASILSS